MCTSPFPEIAAIETYLLALERKYRVHFNRNAIAMDSKEGWKMIHVVIDDCESATIEDGETKLVSAVAFVNTTNAVAICPVVVTRTGDTFSSWSLLDDAGNSMYTGEDPFSDPVRARLFFVKFFIPTCSIDSISVSSNLQHATISGTIDLGFGWFSVVIGTFTAEVEIELKNPLSIEDKQK